MDARGHPDRRCDSAMAMTREHHMEALQTFADMVRRKGLPDKGIVTFEADLIRQLIGTIDALGGEDSGVAPRIKMACTRLKCFVLGHYWTCDAEHGIQPTAEQIRMGVDGFYLYARPWCLRCFRYMTPHRRPPDMKPWNIAGPKWRAAQEQLAARELDAR